MISLSIVEVKNFMAKLLTNTVFDDFILKDMDAQMLTGFHISGQFNESFLTEEEREERINAPYILWSDVRSTVFAMIKGKSTPVSLKIVLQLSPNQTEEFMIHKPENINMEDIGGLYLNIRFETGKLFIVTGVGMKTFSMDKTLEREWDYCIKEFLKKKDIVFEEDL